MIDEHCFKIFNDWADGKVTKEKAEELMSIHGDKLLYDMFTNGFKTSVKVENTNQWVGSIGE